MTQDFFLNSWLKSWISRSLQFGWYWLGQFGMTEINSTLRRPKFSREIFWMEQLVFWGNTRDSWLPTNIHKLLPWCSFLVIGTSGCISKVVSFSISPWLGVCYARGHTLFMFSLLDIQNNSIFFLKKNNEIWILVISKYTCNVSLCFHCPLLLNSLDVVVNLNYTVIPLLELWQKSCKIICGPRTTLLHKVLP